MDRQREDARKKFPAGLVQPEGGYRFSADALLLAEFAAGLEPGQHAAVADLGAGCGVAGFGLMLRRPDLRVVGLEKNPEMAAAARCNAARLGLSGYRLTEGDAAQKSALRAAREALCGESAAGAAPREKPDLPLFDMVLANPPWRVAGSGRVPPSPGRRDALLDAGLALPLFLAAADALLKNLAPLAMICGADRLRDALAALPCRLRPVRLRFVHGNRDGNAAFFLLEARKNSRAALTVEPPLFLEP